MALMNWDQILQSPEYTEAVRTFTARNPFLALPQQAASRAVLPGVVGEKLRLQDIGAKLAMGQQDLDIKRRGVALENRQATWMEGRRPYATAIGLAGVGVEALRGYGTITHGQRQEQRLTDMGKTAQETLEQQKKMGLAQIGYYEQMTDLYKKNPTRLSMPDF